MFAGIERSINSINSLQELRLSSIARHGTQLNLQANIHTKREGLYWIYSSYTLDDFITSSPSTKRGSINFSELTLRNYQRSDLCEQTIDGYRLVYNGIGGVGPKGAGGLRERILGEFRGGEGTGSLAIQGSTLFDLQKWRISYVLWSEIDFGRSLNYNDYSDTIEHLWRIVYGWPLLCNK